MTTNETQSISKLFQAEEQEARRSAEILYNGLNQLSKEVWDEVSKWDSSPDRVTLTGVVLYRTLVWTASELKGEWFNSFLKDEYKITFTESGFEIGRAWRGFLPLTRPLTGLRTEDRELFIERLTSEAISVNSDTRRFQTVARKELFDNFVPHVRWLRKLNK